MLVKVCKQAVPSRFANLDDVARQGLQPSRFANLVNVCNKLVVKVLEAARPCLQTKVDVKVCNKTGCQGLQTWLASSLFNAMLLVTFAQGWFQTLTKACSSGLQTLTTNLVANLDELACCFKVCKNLDVIDLPCCLQGLQPVLVVKPKKASSFVCKP